MKSEKQGQSAIEPPTGDRAPAGEGRSRAGGDKRGRSRAGNGQRGTTGVEVYRPEDLVSALLELEAGNFSARLPENGAPLDIRTAQAFNRVAARNEAMAKELARVAREVGTDGRLGGQAEVPNVAGTWKDLTDSVNSMASNLTAQMRNIALVTTAVATGDLTQKITVDARGEVLDLKKTINQMVDQLGA